MAAPGPPRGPSAASIFHPPDLQAMCLQAMSAGNVCLLQTDWFWGAPLTLLDLEGQRGRAGLGHSAPTLMDLDPQQSKSVAQVSSASLLPPAAASTEATDGPSTSAVPAAVADPILAADLRLLKRVCCQQCLCRCPRTSLTLQSPLACAYEQRMLTYLLPLPGKQSSMSIPTLHRSSASIPQQIALAFPSRCRSSWPRQSEQSLVMRLSTCCVAQTHSQTVQPQTTVRQTTPPCQPQQQQRLWQPPDRQAGSTNQPQSTGKCPLQPLGGVLNEPPQTPLYSFCLSTSKGSARGTSGRHCLQSCKLGHGISLLCKRHTMLPRQRLPHGAERGCYRHMGWPIILGCWHISQPRRGLVVQGLTPSLRGLSLCWRPLWQIYCCSRHLERQPCHHGVSVCSCREAGGASTFLPAKPPSCHASRHTLTSRG